MKEFNESFNFLDYFKRYPLISCVHRANNYQNIFWCRPYLKLSISHEIAFNLTVLFFSDLSIINSFDQAPLYYLHKGSYATHQWSTCFQTIIFFSRANHGLSKILFIPISFSKWNQRDASFESILKINLIKDATQAIQYMQLFDYFAFWKQILTRFKIKTTCLTLLWFFVLNFILSFWVYHLMVYDKVTFYRFQQQKVWVKTRGSIKKDCLFWTTFLSACIITSNLVREAMTFMKKLFMFWERHLSIQIIIQAMTHGYKMKGNS